MSMLNTVGRVCLAKSVMASIPSYIMQVFWLPRSLIGRMNQLMRSFIWSKGRRARGWHLVNFPTITLSKDHGGLGIRNMKLANTALLGKTIWSLLHHSNKLWVQVLKHKYFGSNSILQIQPSANASPIWKRYP